MRPEQITDPVTHAHVGDVGTDSLDDADRVVFKAGKVIAVEMRKK